MYRILVPERQNGLRCTGQIYRVCKGHGGIGIGRIIPVRTVGNGVPGTPVIGVDQCPIATADFPVVKTIFKVIAERKGCRWRVYLLDLHVVDIPAVPLSLPRIIPQSEPDQKS